MEGFLRARNEKNIPVCCVFDNEEVGSRTRQGANSDFLERTLTRIAAGLHLDYHQALAQSFMVSADNAHALHPNHPEYADAGNRPAINQGIVVKFNANQSYTTDGISAAIFRKACQKAEVPVQTFFNPRRPAGRRHAGQYLHLPCQHLHRGRGSAPAGHAFVLRNRRREGQRISGKSHGVPVCHAAHRGGMNLISRLPHSLSLCGRHFSPEMQPEK